MSLLLLLGCILNHTYTVIVLCNCSKKRCHNVMLGKSLKKHFLVEKNILERTFSKLLTSQPFLYFIPWLKETRDQFLIN